MNSYLILLTLAMQAYLPVQYYNERNDRIQVTKIVINRYNSYYPLYVTNRALRIMDRGKELFKIIYLMYLLGKGHQPLSGNDYLQQTMYKEQNEIDIVNNRQNLENFIRRMQNLDPEELLNRFLDFICNFDEYFLEPQHQNEEINLDFAVNIYVCCILFQMGLQFPIRPDSNVPPIDVLCDMVQKQLPMLEHDADAILGKLNYSFLVFDNGKMSENEHDKAPRRMNDTSMDLAKIMYLLMKENKTTNKKAKFIANKFTGSNSGKIYDSAEMYELIKEIEPFIEIIEKLFGTNGVVTLKLKKISYAPIGSCAHFNESIESSDACPHFKDNVDFSEVAFHDGAIFREKTIKIWQMELSLNMPFQQHRCGREV